MTEAEGHFQYFFSFEETVAWPLRKSDKLNFPLYNMVKCS